MAPCFGNSGRISLCRDRFGKTRKESHPPAEKMRCIVFVFTVLLNARNVRADCVDIVTRKDWGGSKPALIDYIIFPVRNVIVHHTAAAECLTEETCVNRMKEISALEHHDVGYNFLIGGDGRVYEGVGWHKLGSHTKGYNGCTIGVALIGHFEEKSPKTKQLEALKDLLDCGVISQELDRNYKLLAARQLMVTLSPGKRLHNILKSWPHTVNDRAGANLCEVELKNSTETRKGGLLRRLIVLKSLVRAVATYK